MAWADGLYTNKYSRGWRRTKNKVLMYNLGCNRVGILTSIYGGKRISDILAGAVLAPSLFDPRAVYFGAKTQVERREYAISVHNIQSII